METYIFVRNGYMWSFNDYNDRSRVHLKSYQHSDFVIHAKGGVFTIVKNRKDNKEYWSLDFNAIRKYIQMWYDGGAFCGIDGRIAIQLAELIEDRSDYPSVEKLQEMIERL